MFAANFAQYFKSLICLPIKGKYTIIQLVNPKEITDEDSHKVEVILQQKNMCPINSDILF